MSADPGRIRRAAGVVEVADMQPWIRDGLADGTLGFCRVCGRLESLCQDGTVRSHWYRCAGSRKPPKELT